jgi:hypothetical protein
VVVLTPSPAMVIAGGSICGVAEALPVGLSGRRRAWGMRGQGRRSELHLDRDGDASPASDGEGEALRGFSPAES